MCSHSSTGGGMRAEWRIGFMVWAFVVAGCKEASDVASPDDPAPSRETGAESGSAWGHDAHAKEATTLYIWASDQDGASPDFLAVIDFDRKSPDYGKVLKTL